MVGTFVYHNTIINCRAEWSLGSKFLLGEDLQGAFPPHIYINLPKLMMYPHILEPAIRISKMSSGLVDSTMDMMPTNLKW